MMFWLCVKSTQLVKLVAMLVLAVAVRSAATASPGNSSAAGAAAAAGGGGGSCGRCQLSECVKAVGCRAGVVMDRCQCCAICGKREGELCRDAAVERAVGVVLGEERCGDNLQCQIVETEEANSGPKQAVCVCRALEMVCGSDDNTYDNLCQLMEQSFSEQADQQSLRVESWGPCETAPKIISGMSDTVVERGAEVNMDCEVMGYPMADIVWQKTEEDGSVTFLPGFLSDVSVQTRGGPSPLTITSWLQITAAEPHHAGSYNCSAANKFGAANHVTVLGVFGKSTAQSPPH